MKFPKIQSIKAFDSARQIAKIVNHGFSYLLRAEFNTPYTAGTIPNPLPVEVGNLTLTDTGNVSSISGGAWGYSSANPTIGSIGFQAAAEVRVIGKTIKTRFSALTAFPTATTWLAWWRNMNLNYSGGNNISHGFYTQNGDIRIIENSGALSLNPAITLSTDTVYDVAISLKSIGAFYWIKGGAFIDWTLIWSGTTDNTVNPYPTLAPANGGANASVSYEYFRATQLGGAFATDNGIATLNIASPISGQSYVATADQILDIDVSAPGTLANFAGIKFNVQDANNYWIAYFDNNGAFKVDTIIAGVTANRINVAGVIAGGQTRTIRVISSGSLRNAYTLSGTTWTKRGAQLNINHTNAAVNVEPIAGAGWTLSNLRSYPKESPLYAVLDLI